MVFSLAVLCRSGFLGLSYYQLLRLAPHVTPTENSMKFLISRARSIGKYFEKEWKQNINIMNRLDTVVGDNGWVEFKEIGSSVLVGSSG